MVGLITYGQTKQVSPLSFFDHKGQYPHFCHSPPTNNLLKQDRKYDYRYLALHSSGKSYHPATSSDNLSLIVKIRCFSIAYSQQAATSVRREFPHTFNAMFGSPLDSTQCHHPRGMNRHSVSLSSALYISRAAKSWKNLVCEWLALVWKRFLLLEQRGSVRVRWWTVLGGAKQMVLVPLSKNKKLSWPSQCQVEIFSCLQYQRLIAQMLLLVDPAFVIVKYSERKSGSCTELGFSFICWIDRFNSPLYFLNA